MEGQATSQQQGAFLNLSGARVVTFKDRGQDFVLRFRHLGSDDWRRYFAGMALESERVGQQRVDRFDFTSAGIALVDEALIGASGYKTRDGAALTSSSDWKRAIPYGHKSLALGLLTSVTRSNADRVMFFEPDVQEVVLDAKWGVEKEGVPAVMLQFSGLVHRFQQVTVEHQRRYNRATSEARVVGGSRSGRTIYPGRHGLLADMYDELILGVEGYAWDGAPLVTLAEMKERMDTFHKVAAVTELFAVPEEE